MLRAHNEEILAKPNVVGVGIAYKEIRGKSTGQLGITALVHKKMSEAHLMASERVPKYLEHVATDVVQVGRVRSLRARTDRWRPAPGGVSLGHYRVTAGTLGCVVRDAASGDHLILSNNHVLANNNNAHPGDRILQPGNADSSGRSVLSPIAHLERFCPLGFRREAVPSGIHVVQATGSSTSDPVHAGMPRPIRPLDLQLPHNRIDAAVARPVRNNIVLDTILGIGTVAGVAPPVLGMRVRKSGRATAVTTGIVTVLEVTVDVAYYGGRTARFEDQIVTTAMGQAGDSGSLLVEKDSSQAVGLLFAGSSGITVHNPIRAVLDELEVVL